MKTTKKQKPEFIQISPNEVKINYRGKKFLLKEKNRGIYGAGKAISLHELKELDTNFIKEIGWTNSDGQSKFDTETLLKKLSNWDECKTEAIKYIDTLLA
jgi:hypothetical protein